MAKISPMMILPPAIFAAVAGLFLSGMMGGDNRELPSALIGKQAAELPETPLGGNPAFDAAALRDGQVKLVNFWASWCGPCRVEHPNIAALAEAGLPVYGINYKDKPEQALAFLAELGNPYAAIVADETGRSAIEWGVYGVPETYLVDGDGVILERVAGPVTQRMIDTRLKPILSEAGITLP